MSNPNFIINDSEGESDGAIAGDPSVYFSPAQIVPALAHEPNAYQTIPASGELRKKAIDEAHAALLSTATPTSPMIKAHRRQTTNGRLEGPEPDVYAFPPSSPSSDFHPGPAPTKRKRPTSEKKPRAKKHNDDNGDVSDYSRGQKSSKKKKPTKHPGSVLDLLNDSSDDYSPARAKKSTDLSKRKPTPHHEQRFENSFSAEIQVAATTSPTPQFVVDLTNNDLAPIHRAEYSAVSPELSSELLPNVGGVYATPDLLSTIPDPPYDPTLLPSQIGELHLYPPIPASDSPLSSLENSPAKPKPNKASKVKKRAVTDNLETLGNFPVASEWRAAKGRSRTMNDLDRAESGDDDDIWGSKPPKKKQAAKKRKATQGDAATKKQVKRKVETLVLTDSEDELAASVPAAIQVLVEGTAPPVESEVDAGVGGSGDGDVMGTIAVNSFSGMEALAEVESDLTVVEDPPKPKQKKQTAAQRRKSKRDEEEEGDWTGDPEPKKKKVKTPRVTKKAAAAAIKEAKEKKEENKLSEETVKDSEDEGDGLGGGGGYKMEEEEEKKEEREEEKVVVKEKGKKAQKKEPKLSKAAAARKAKEAEETASEKEQKKEVTPMPEIKPAPEPQTPSKKLVAEKKKTPHSPINKGPVKFRVGLSRRANIEPLLKIIRK